MAPIVTAAKVNRANLSIFATVYAALLFSPG